MKQSNLENKYAEWYRDAFGSDYLWLYAHRSDTEARHQVNKLLEFVPFTTGQKILDIACGAGRHMLALAANGARVTGIDLSDILLKVARKKFAGSPYRATLRRLDMRDITYSNAFDGITLWFTSLGYFPTFADDFHVMKLISRALKSRGWWMIDLPHPAYLEKNLVPLSERTVVGPHGPARIIEKRWITGRHVRKTIDVTDSAGHRCYRESVRLYRPEQINDLFRRAGLMVDGVLGDYDGIPLSSESPRQLWFGRRKK